MGYQSGSRPEGLCRPLPAWRDRSGLPVSAGTRDGPWTAGADGNRIGPAQPRLRDEPRTGRDAADGRHPYRATSACRRPAAPRPRLPRSPSCRQLQVHQQHVYRLADTVEVRFHEVILTRPPRWIQRARQRRGKSTSLRDTRNASRAVRRRQPSCPSCRYTKGTPQVSRWCISGTSQVYARRISGADAVPAACTSADHAASCEGRGDSPADEDVGPGADRQRGRRPGGVGNPGQVQPRRTEPTCAVARNAPDRSDAPGDEGAERSYGGGAVASRTVLAPSLLRIRYLRTVDHEAGRGHTPGRCEPSAFLAIVDLAYMI